MIEKIKILNIKRDPGYLYFVDKEGDVSKVKIGKKKKEEAKEEGKEEETEEIKEEIKEEGKEEGNEIQKKLGDLGENKFIWLLIGLGIGALMGWFLTKSYYDKKIVEYQGLIEKQQEQINQLLSLQTTGLSSETQEQYLLRKFREQMLIQ